MKYCEEFGWMLEDDKLAAMRAKNDAELKQCDERCVVPPVAAAPAALRRVAQTLGCRARVSRARVPWAAVTSWHVWTG